MNNLFRSAYRSHVNHVFLLLAATTSSSLAACGEEATRRVVEDPIGEGLLPSDWPGMKLGVELPTFVETGKAELTKAKNDGPTRGVDTMPFEQVPITEFELADLTRASKFEVTTPMGIELVASARAAELAAAAAKDPAPVEPSSSKSITGGVDTRVPMGVAQGYGIEGWMAAIGMLANGGTATLISPTVAISAAHAVFDPDTGAYNQDGFVPREDWTDRTQASLQPYDWWPITQITVPAAYTRNRCWAREHPTNCDQYDIAFIRVSRPPQAQNHRWYFTVAAETREQLLSRPLKNRGYPSCYMADAPANCMDLTLYGDAQNCQLGPDRYTAADGWSSNVFHGCDTNDGHSGSPIFYYQQSGPPVIVGVHVSGFPMFDSPTKNAFKRITPNTLSWIHGLL
jgi:V8-like Glu-specific endopeptidase